MIYLIPIWFYLTVFLFIWYSYKLIRDVSGIDQYWHIPQMIFLIIVYSPMLYFYGWQFGFLAIQFPFLFNSGLNAYRKLPINYLGKYDWLKFYQTISLFVIGIVGSIIYLYV